MLNFLSIVLIILIIFILFIFKRKYIIDVFNKKGSYPKKAMDMDNENNIITSSSKKYNHYQNSFNKYSEFYKRKLRVQMNNLFNGSGEDKLKALNIAEELADKSTLPILRLGLKDMDPKIVELSASLIKKFK
tara:strand:+ start:210 stop:605 length:396 start_codon:yes stop_codon:yes gene_type:complete